MINSRTPILIIIINNFYSQSHKVFRFSFTTIKVQITTLIRPENEKFKWDAYQLSNTIVDSNGKC